MRVCTNFFKSLVSLPDVRLGLGIRLRTWRWTWLRTWLGLWIRSVLRTVRFSTSKFVTNTSFVVIASWDSILSHCLDWSTSYFSILVRHIPETWHVTCSICWKSWLVTAFNIIFGLQIKEIQPIKVILTAILLFLVPAIAFQSTVYNVGCRSKVRPYVHFKISVSRYEESCHYIMHTWLRVLWSHVEPDTRCHSQGAILVD